MGLISKPVARPHPTCRVVSVLHSYNFIALRSPLSSRHCDCAEGAATRRRLGHVTERGYPRWLREDIHLAKCNAWPCRKRLPKMEKLPLQERPFPSWKALAGAAAVMASLDKRHCARDGMGTGQRIRSSGSGQCRRPSATEWEGPFAQAPRMSF